ncbi:MAG: hypothetical protein Q9191_003388 [Dirinaria sp. TL-2023a]
MLSPFIALFFWIVALLFTPGLALPHNDGPATPGCAVQKFFDQTPQDWVDHRTDEWLDDWFKTHDSDIKANHAGFAGAFGRWALEDPDWSCLDDGSDSNCDFSPCHDICVNGTEDDVRHAYYVLESVRRLHDYHTVVAEAFSVSVDYAALNLATWVQAFYKDQEVVPVPVEKEVFNALSTVLGIVAGVAALGGPQIAATAGVANAVFAGVTNAVTPLFGQHLDDTPKKVAEIGKILGDISVEAAQALSDTNNKLMKGESLKSGDIRSYLAGGSFVSFEGINKSALIDKLNRQIYALTVNAIWRAQPVFILGGGACGDNQGIGSGPREASLCRNDRAWYLYYWKETHSLNHSIRKIFGFPTGHGGHVEAPPGLDTFGNSSSITVSDAIRSSLETYDAFNYDYTPETRTSRALAVIEDISKDPSAQGPVWEGMFTIPVCDISNAVFRDARHRKSTLVPYGHKKAPTWCAGDESQWDNSWELCSGSSDQFFAFLEAAHLHGMEFWAGCEH